MPGLCFFLEGGGGGGGGGVGGLGCLVLWFWVFRV